MSVIPSDTPTPATAASTGAVPATASTADHARRIPFGLDRGAVLGYIALLPILVGAVLLNTHRLAQNGYANTFYSSGVKSMLLSLHNFFFVSFDPGGLITIDKPPLGLWLQATSAAIFGFHPLSLLLPEALIGVVCVAVLFTIVRRPFGELAALAAALTLAVAPAFVASSRDNNVDLPLILLMLLACGAAMRAIRGGRWPSLLACAVLVGLAFNTKTLAAYLVVPGIALGYLLCAPDPLGRRALKLLVAGLLMGVVSFAWIAAVELTPSSQRPYVGGTKHNSELELTFDYNGLGRVEGEVGGPGEIFIRLGGVAPFNPAEFPATPTTTHLTEARTRAPKSATTSLHHLLPDGHYASPTPFAVPPGPLRLFEAGLGDQIGWMLPFALFGMLAVALAVVWERRHPAAADPSAPATQTAAGDPGVAAATTAAGDPRAAATQTAAAQTAAAQTAAAQTAAAQRGGGRRDDRGTASHLARIRRDPRTAGLLVLGGWFLTEALILSFSKGIVHPYYTSALAPGAAAMVGAGAGAFIDAARRRQWWLILMPAAVAGTVAAQIVQLHRQQYMHWFHVPLALGAGACALLLLGALLVRRLAIPAMALTLLVLSIAPTLYARTTWWIPVQGTFPAAGPKAAGALGPDGMTEHDVKVDTDLMRYVDAHRPTHRWELLTVSSDSASGFILLGHRAAALGGYSGTDPAVNGPRLARMVAHREARYVVLGGAYASRGGNLATRAVIKACRQIPNEAWLHFRRFSVYSYVLYDCAGDERRLAAQV